MVGLADLRGGTTLRTEIYQVRAGVLIKNCTRLEKLLTVARN
jgi:hypothetical protein